MVHLGCKYEALKVTFSKIADHRNFNKNESYFDVDI